MANKKVNRPLTTHDVKNTATHVLDIFEQMVRKEIPFANVVLDEELTYTSALQEVFKRSSYDNTTNTPLPLFAYNREILKKTESAMGRRFSNTFGNVKMLDGSTVKYTMTNSEFDINFNYITEDIRSAEEFEVVFNSDDGISGSKEIELNIPDIGLFKYFLTYNELASKETVFNEVYYKNVIGSITVRGFYFVFHSVGKQINEINSRIIKSNDLLLKSEEEILGTTQSLGV